MKKLLLLAAFAACLPAAAQRTVVTPAPINTIPQCSATSGACPNPSGGYFCTDSDNDVLYMCRSDTGWKIVDVGSVKTVTTLPSTCSAGDIVQKTDATTGQQLYMCESGTWVQQAGGGGGGGSSTLSGLTDTAIGTLASGNLLLYDGTNSWDNKAMSGDATITSGGALTIAADSVALGTDTTGDYVSGITSGQGIAVSAAEGGTVGLRGDCSDGQVLKWIDLSSTWTCQADLNAASGSAQSLDLGNNGGTLESTDINAFATTGDTGTASCSTAGGAGCIFTEPSDDKVLVDLSQNWPTADTATTATALAANGANCSAGEIPLGVDASGAVESCYEPAFTDVTGTATDAQIPSEVVKTDENNAFTTGLQSIDGDADEIQFRIQAHSTQTANIMVVEDSTGTDIVTIDSDSLDVADPGDDLRGLELLDNTTDCANPTSGYTSLCSKAGAIYFRDTGGSTTQLLTSATSGDITDVWTCASGDCSTLTATTGDSLNAGGADDLEIPNGGDPTVDTTGQVAIDTTDDQLTYYGAASQRFLSPTQTYCAVFEDLAAADDNYEIWMSNDAVTVTGVGCHCKGTCTTAASISLEDRSGNAMTHTAPTCSTGTTSTTFQSVTASGGLVAGEGLRFDVDNAVSPETDEYTICFTFIFAEQ